MAEIRPYSRYRKFNMMGQDVEYDRRDKLYRFEREGKHYEFSDAEMSLARHVLFTSNA